MLKVVEETIVGEEGIGRETLDEIARLGAPPMLRRALVEESGCYVEVHEDERDGQGRRAAFLARRRRNARVGGHPMR